MVFRGKPSAACLRCRQRRIKCDQNPAGCSSCARMHVQCEGYRDRDVVRFCHETDVVKHKVKGPTKRSPKTPSTGESTPTSVPLTGSITPPDETFQVGFLTEPPAIRPPLAPSMDDFALRFCFDHYDYTTDAVFRTCGADGHVSLMSCVKAIGLATFANTSHSPRLAQEARISYVSALSHTNAALASPTLAYEDGTLLSVMILLHLETMMNSREDSLSAWTSHVNGCAALLQHRGPAQLQTFERRHLFLQACVNLLSHCLLTGTRAPNAIRELSQAAPPFGRKNYESVTWGVLKARILLADLYADFASGRMKDFHGAALQAIRAAETLEELYGNKDDWESDVFLSDHSPFLLRVHLSYGGQISIVVTRTLLHLLIVALLRECDTEDAAMQSQISQTAIASLQELILATASHQADLVRKENAFISQDAHRLLSAQIGVSNVAFVRADEVLMRSLIRCTKMSVLNEQPAMRLSRGYSLIWAPYLVGEIAAAGSDVRRRAIGVLRGIGKEFEIKQADVLASRLEENHGKRGGGGLLQHIQES